MRLQICAAVGAAVLAIAGECSPPAHADPPTPPTPTPVIGTGGNTSGTSPGSGCMARTPQKFTPADPGNPNAWANPDWPGWAPIVVPTPGNGCSR